MAKGKYGWDIQSTGLKIRGFSIGDKMMQVLKPDPQKVQIDQNWCTQRRSKGLQELKMNIIGEGCNVEVLQK